MHVKYSAAIKHFVICNFSRILHDNFCELLITRAYIYLYHLMILYKFLLIIYNRKIVVFMCSKQICKKILLWFML